MTKIRTCVEDRCERDCLPRRQRCLWHWLMTQGQSVQDMAARDREPSSGLPRFPPPELHKVMLETDHVVWCKECQGWIPKFYTKGPHCKPHASLAAHAARVVSTYDMQPGEYEALLAYQGGVCYVCGRKSSRRLAVDHDHVTNEVRGLLCSDSERGCNHKVIGLLEANSVDGGIRAAGRVLRYLGYPPMRRMRDGTINVETYRDAGAAPF